MLGGGDPDACLDRPVCASCFGDPALKGIVDGVASYTYCEFCGAEAEHAIATDLYTVVQHMHECLAFYFGMAEDKLPYESAEGGYQGEWWTTAELLLDVLTLDLPNDHDGKLFDAIVHSLGDQAWCRRSPFSLTREEHLRFSWDEFCHLIKHESARRASDGPKTRTKSSTPLASSLSSGLSSESRDSSSSSQPGAGSIEFGAKLSASAIGQLRLWVPLPTRERSRRTG